MKTLLLIALTISMYSCTKCEQCTRTWTSQTYDVYPDGTITDVSTEQSQTELFTACTNADIKAAEEVQRTENQIDMGTHIRHINYTGECDCK